MQDHVEDEEEVISKEEKKKDLIPKTLLKPEDHTLSHTRDNGTISKMSKKTIKNNIKDPDNLYV